MPNAPDAPAEDIARLRGIITQYFSSRALYAAAALDGAGTLAGGAKTIDELATATGAHALSLNGRASRACRLNLKRSEHASQWLAFHTPMQEQRHRL